MILGGGVAAGFCLLLSSHRAVIFVTAQLSCTFLAPAHPGSAGQRAVKQLLLLLLLLTPYKKVMSEMLFPANLFANTEENEIKHNKIKEQNRAYTNINKSSK